MINAELMSQVRTLLIEHPERHRQAIYYGTLGNSGLTSETNVELMRHVPADEIAAYALQPVPDKADNPERPICQTTACVAGWTAVLGAPAGVMIDLYNDTVDDPDYTPPEDSDGENHVHEYAASLLGLNANQAQWLFAGSRTRWELIAALEWFPAHPDASPDDLRAEFG